jgi:Mg2+/Co2+ transporter CorC
MKILGLSKTKKGSLTRDDFKILLETITGKGVLQQREKGFIERIMNIKNVVAREIMIPLNRLICVEENEEIGRIGSLMASSEWTSLPVYRERVDNVIGYIDNKDVIRAKQSEKVKKYIREALYVPEYVTIDHVLLDMQNKASQMAFAVDEYGSVAGIITSQNLISEVVGEIMESGDNGIENKGDYYLVDGMMDIDELEDELGVTIEKTGFETVAGFVMSRLERMAAAGDRFDYDKWTFEVISVNELRIDQVAVFLKRRKKKIAHLQTIQQRRTLMELHDIQPRKIKSVQREAEVVIEKYAADGVSLAHDEGKAVYVRFAVPEKRMRVNIYRETKGLRHRRAVELLERSPLRIEPECPYFGMCGGCDISVSCHMTSRSRSRNRSYSKPSARSGSSKSITLRVKLLVRKLTTTAIPRPSRSNRS